MIQKHIGSYLAISGVIISGFLTFVPKSGQPMPMERTAIFMITSVMIFIGVFLWRYNPKNKP